MPSEGPGARYDVLFTKACTHGDPAVENNHPGIAAKSQQAAPAAVNEANALAAQQIAIGEEAVIMLKGVHDVAVDLLPAGADEGDLLFITVADNSLADAAEALTGGLIEAGFVRFGLISEIDDTTDIAQVNLDLKDVL